MRTVGILPTITSDYELLYSCIDNIFSQHKPPELLLVVYQGDVCACNMIKERLVADDRTIILTTQVMSLTHAKNLALDYLNSYKFEYVFVYEDDVIYPSTYSCVLIEALIESNAQIISAVQSIKINLLSKIRALLYVVSHLYPLNDIRPFVESFCFSGIGVFRTRFLYGGLSMYTKNVAEKYRYDENLTRYALGEDMDFSFRVSESHISIITNKIRCIHNSQGTRKFGNEFLYRNKISWWCYFINKYYNNKIVAKLSLFNLISFMFVESLLTMIYCRSISIPFAFIKSCIDIFILKKKSDFIINA